MMSPSSKPTNKIIKETLDNMLGASIQAIYDFCKKRASLNPRDKTALIGFNKEVSEIFIDIPIGDEHILNKCLSKLKPNGVTCFINAFKKAKNIIENIDRKYLAPIIILLTDGLDHTYKKTIDFIEKEVSN